ncbi:hypothetical protein [Methylosinus sp. KRF6]|uniref:hypothetical protein n=1 Tax=Methylosinus sp. KRF6 TaxID=2846853 RepID=UPI001C0CA003|nr:hypothetical protein [Methylosinus sp. KRF6]MBU3891022.1 hypothetical protein [Methylosinus sp. KRF6]
MDRLETPNDRLQANIDNHGMTATGAQAAKTHRRVEAPERCPPFGNSVLLTSSPRAGGLKSAAVLGDEKEVVVLDREQ